ncbi:hypothetical protein NQ318_020077 [Aromia moschata]|uniref:Uncharacterized protein n=1 Tax=Aromia moschata TaxID=1265417 RepID=A0AAV8Z9A0_9CUCU|nr:hypothetical protein NQ318_020077 [Aromia moschata]
MEKVPTIPAGETGNIVFNFEPSDLGILLSKVVLTSPITGDYIYPLIGEGTRPTAKGPFVVQAGSSTPVNFVNPFEDEKTFNYVVDSDAFFLKSSSESIKPKKVVKIFVNMQPMRNLDAAAQKYGVTAKLVVSVDNPDPDDVKWVYYIRGEP